MGGSGGEGTGGPRPRMASSAATTSSMLEKRFSRCFRVARRMMASRRGSRSSTSQEGGGRGEKSWWSKSSLDRKSTRLNSSHVRISYAVFCLKKKKKKK